MHEIMGSIPALMHNFSNCLKFCIYTYIRVYTGIYVDKIAYPSISWYMLTYTNINQCYKCIYKSCVSYTCINSHYTSIYKYIHNSALLFCLILSYPMLLFKMVPETSSAVLRAICLYVQKCYMMSFFIWSYPGCEDSKRNA